MVFERKDHRKSGPIKLTHYVSPHEFWFKYIDDNAEDDLQERIQRLGTVSRHHHNYTPSVGEIVILDCCFGDGNRYIRARVDFELKYATGSEFVLWAIDEGFPIQSKTRWIIKLTSEGLKADNPRVFKATLDRVVPATSQYDFLEREILMVPTKSWSVKAINEFEKISNAESLIFHYHCHAAAQHLYGSLEVISFTGNSVNMDDQLKNLEEAVAPKNFEKEYQKLVRKDYWLQEQENYKIKENVPGAIQRTPQTAVKALKPKNIQEINTIDKINDWDKRNQRSLSKPEITQENTDSLCEKVQGCNLSKLPLNKRFEYCSKLSAAQPSTSKAMSISSNSSRMSSKSDESFHSASAFIQSEQSEALVRKNGFKRALLAESVSPMEKSKILMHCQKSTPIVRPISSIQEAPFDQEIHDKLKEIGKQQVFRTQAVPWPHLMRRNSLIVINAPKSGKTYTYVPPVCALLVEATNDNKVEACEGTVVIIVCLDATAVTNVRKSCRELLGLEYSIEVSIQYDNDDLQYKLLNGIHILVATVPSLLRLARNPLKLINKNRLTTIVFDEIDSMCDRFGEADILTLYKMFCEDSNIQTIVTSKTWHKTLKKFSDKDSLLICIGGYMEAALYSNIDLTVTSTNEKKRFEQFLSIFRKLKYNVEQILVVCSKSTEVDQIKRILESEALTMCTYCNDKTDSETIGAINDRIRQNPAGALGVLVCTDEVLGDLVFRNAQHIIHFSLPENWTDFTKRFLASFDYYENMVEDGLSAGRPTSVVFVDEYSVDCMPRLIEFMKNRCNANVPDRILKLAMEKRIEREQSQQTKYRNFCENVLLLGDCYDKYVCEFRHILTKADRPDGCIPRSGKIRFQITDVHSPAHFTVRLLEHCPSERSEWQRMPDADNFLKFRMEFEAHFQDTKNHLIHSPAQVGDLCVFDDDDGGEVYKRCEIVAIEKGAKMSKVELLPIDSNFIKEIKCNATHLLVLPEKFKKFPRQAVDIRIAGVVPFDLSTTWDKDLISIVKDKWFEAKKNCHIQGTIEMTTMKCIWVKSIEIVEKLPSISEEVVKFNAKKEIISRNWGVAKANSLEMLRELAEKAGILDTSPFIIPPAQVLSPNQSPNLSPNQSPNQSPNLAHQNMQTRGSGRGKVLSLSSNDSLYSAKNSGRGNQSWAVEDANDSNTCLAKAMTKSVDPVASLKCVPEWAALVPKTYNEVDIGEFYSPDRLYVLRADEFRSFSKLRRNIYVYMEKSRNRKPLVKVEEDEICLAAAEYDGNDFRRAQIMKVNDGTVDIFLVDYGTEEYNVPLSDLIEIPEKFIKRLPFQAILCKMTDIRPPNGSEEWSHNVCTDINKILNGLKSIFVRSAGRCSVSDDFIKCNSYEAVYADKLTQQIINELIVKEGLADFAPNTERFIDEILDWKSLHMVGDVDDVEEDWDNDSDDDDENKFNAQCGLDRNEEKKSSMFDSCGFNDDDKEWDVHVDADYVNEWLKQITGENINVNNAHELPAIKAAEPVEQSVEKTVEQPVEQVAQAAAIEPLPQKTAEDFGNAFTPEQIKSIKLSRQLTVPAKMPNIVWRQTESLVTMKILAPDAKDYSLKVGSRYVHFCFIANNERFENILNLFGCVDARHTVHEMPGNEIVVRLKKTLAKIHWPRLEQSPDKNRFIKCIDDIGDDNENLADDFMPHRMRNIDDTQSSSTGDDDDVNDEDDDNDGVNIHDIEF